MVTVITSGQLDAGIKNPVTAGSPKKSEASWEVS